MSLKRLQQLFYECERAVAPHVLHAETFIMCRNLVWVGTPVASKPRADCREEKKQVRARGTPLLLCSRRPLLWPTTYPVCGFKRKYHIQGGGELEKSVHSLLRAENPVSAASTCRTRLSRLFLTPPKKKTDAFQKSAFEKVKLLALPFFP